MFYRKMTLNASHAQTGPNGLLHYKCNSGKSIHPKKDFYEFLSSYGYKLESIPCSPSLFKLRNTSQQLVNKRAANIISSCMEDHFDQNEDTVNFCLNPLKKARHNNNNNPKSKNSKNCQNSNANNCCNNSACCTLIETVADEESTLNCSHEIVCTKCRNCNPESYWTKHELCAKFIDMEFLYDHPSSLNVLDTIVSRSGNLPNVCTHFTYYLAEYGVWIVMEYIPGIDMWDYMTKFLCREPEIIYNHLPLNLASREKMNFPSKYLSACENTHQNQQQSAQNCAHSTILACRCNCDLSGNHLDQKDRLDPLNQQKDSEMQIQKSLLSTTNCGDRLLHSTLSQMIKNRSDERQLAQVLYNITVGICSLHSVGIIHGDIKPENVLISPANNLPNNLHDSMQESSNFSLSDPSINYKVAIVDVSSSVTFSDVLSSMEDPRLPRIAPGGSLLYMAPELLRNCAFDERVDIWALGIMTCILLSGTTPFKEMDVSTYLDAYMGSKFWKKSNSVNPIGSFDSLNEKQSSLQSHFEFKQITDEELKFIRKTVLEFTQENRHVRFLSPEAKAFIKETLRENPLDRPHACDLLRHNWFLKNCSDARKQCSRAELQKKHFGNANTAKDLKTPLDFVFPPKYCRSSFRGKNPCSCTHTTAPVLNGKPSLILPRSAI